MGHCEPREHMGKQPAFPRADLNLLSDARSLGMEGQEPRLRRECLALETLLEAKNEGKHSLL